MFGLFNKTKRKIEGAAEIASRVVAMQLALGGADLPTIFKAKDNFALGYVFGAHGGACQATGISHDTPEGFQVLAIGYQTLAGASAQGIIDWSLSMQRDPQFSQGAQLGGQQVIELLRDKKNPVGLAKHLHTQSYAT